MDRIQILGTYPWLAEGPDNTSVIVGDDLDSALSAALFLSLHPGSRVIGVYSGFTTIHLARGIAWEAAQDAVWLDLDINDPRCRSLGHHIVRVRLNDQLVGLATSCNLNELAARSMRNFRLKYPLGTIHFLMWLYEASPLELQRGIPLIWLADSSFINAQQAHYRSNVLQWIANEMPLPLHAEVVRRVDSLQFEESVGAVQGVLEAEGFARGRGQSRSTHKKLSGFQCQPRAADDAGLHMQKLIRVVAELTGWAVRPEQIASLGNARLVLQGQRQTLDLGAVRRAGLDAFLQAHDVFSYALPTGGTINFTARMVPVVP